jgi:hypothetical protein
MRILQHYRFRVGRKIPFDRWPGFVEQFLQEQGLHNRCFHYWLENFDFPKDIGLYWMEAAAGIAMLRNPPVSGAERKRQTDCGREPAASGQPGSIPF